MKKTRILSLLAAVAITAASLGMTAFAADGDTPTNPAALVQGKNETHSIEITKKDDEKHTFEAYQIFKGVLTSDDGTDNNKSAVMTEIDWGDNVDTAKLEEKIAGNDTVKNALAAYNKTLGEGKTCDVTNASQFAAFISANSGTEGFPEAIADLFNSVLKGEYVNHVTIEKDADTKSGVITGLKTGYYLVKDEAGSLKGKNGAYTDFVLQLVNNVKVNAKADAPSIDKNILVDSTKKKGDTASIGDTINYQLDSKVPDMTGYNKYYFIVNDMMSKGLEFQEVSAITVGEASLEKDTDYTVTAAKLEEDDPETDGIDETGMTAVKIVFKGFYEKYNKQAGQPITIRYSAILDDDCDRTVAGNPNVVDLTFSNDPNFDYKGTPENPDEPNPDSDEPTGKTPESKTKVYTTGIRIKKVDETGKPLTGAKFTISGTALNKVITETSAFVEDEAGTYYKLKNGSYTETVPTDETEDKYEDVIKKYKLTTTDSTAVTVTDKETGYEVEVDSEGYIIFSGLGDGTYTIKESEAPTGYNIVADAYTFTIGSTPDFEKPEWTIRMNGADPADAAPTAGNGWTVITQEITNKKGIILPSTGGIGTVVFYVVGSLLIAGAVVLFVNKKKKAAK